MVWGWVNYGRIVTLRWTKPLKLHYANQFHLHIVLAWMLASQVSAWGFGPPIRSMFGSGRFWHALEKTSCIWCARHATNQLSGTNLCQTWDWHGRRYTYKSRVNMAKTQMKRLEDHLQGLDVKRGRKQSYGDVFWLVYGLKVPRKGIQKHLWW